MSDSIEPFEIDVAPARLADLRQRLRSTRWSPELKNDDWTYGMNGAYLRDLVQYWADEYSWPEEQARLNAVHHFRTVMDDVPIHFVHERGRGPNPLPLVLTHGWPETFWDWHRLIGPLVDPAAHGGDPEDSFDVVVPSLPGFAFSTPLARVDVTPPVIAGFWRRLMSEGLGYDRFGAAGNDWGSFVSSELGMQHPDDLVGIYLSYPPRFHVDVEHLSDDDYGPGERDWRVRQANLRARNLSHVDVQTQEPQSLAWALNDSPAGLAAWLIGRRHRWSDHDGDLEAVFARDFLLTTVSLYWLTETIGSSMRIYADSFGRGLRIHSSSPPPRIDVPTGIGVFPAEMTLIPRRACERVANVVHWSVLPRGGHFGPSEQPDLYIDELRRFFRPLR
jgi:pimeloyl-ACP methyl ester carboxylesterase